jgi:endonuclease YncB( thermonuclease family)
MGAHRLHCLWQWPRASATDFVGQAGVIDGDSRNWRGAHSARGIDAPESDQPCRNDDDEHYRCRQKAANGLNAFAARRRVECVEVDRDTVIPPGRFFQSRRTPRASFGRFDPSRGG